MRGEEELITQLVLWSQVLTPPLKPFVSNRSRSPNRRPCISCSNWTEHVRESLDQEVR